MVGSFSIAELIAVLYSNYDIGGNDKLILSKGHAVPIIYAALNELGKISDEELLTFREVNSRLQGHPDKIRLPLLDATTGSLGQGLSIAIGHALAKMLKKEEGAVFCILGDGECQEGQIWESLMYAPMNCLTNLICFIDWNKAQNDGELIEFYNDCHELKNKIEGFGWHLKEIRGNNMKMIEKEISDHLNIRDCISSPLCLILDTTKSKGVSFMEGNPDWHCKVPTKEEYELAVKELEK